MGCSLERELPGFLKIFFSGGWWAGGLPLNTPAFQIDYVIVRGSQHSGLFVRDGTAMLFENFLLWRLVGWWATFKHASFLDRLCDSKGEAVQWAVHWRGKCQAF